MWLLQPCIRAGRRVSEEGAGICLDLPQRVFGRAFS